MNGIDNVLAALVAAAILIVIPVKIYSSALCFVGKQEVLKKALTAEEDLTAVQTRGEIVGLSLRIIAVSLEGEKGKELYELFYEDHSNTCNEGAGERRVIVFETE